MHCQFGAYLEEALRDRFVCGLRSETVQKKLLVKDDLTFQEAIRIAKASEQAVAKASEQAVAKARQLQSEGSTAVSGSEAPLGVCLLKHRRAVATGVGKLTTHQLLASSGPPAVIIVIR